MPSTTYNKGLDSTLTGLNIRAPSKLIIKIFLFPLLDDSTTLTTTLITTFRRVNVTWPEPIRFKPITPKHQPATPWVKSGTDEVHSDLAYLYSGSSNFILHIASRQADN